MTVSNCIIYLNLSLFIIIIIIFLVVPRDAEIPGPEIEPVPQK